jgi:hypothetical protein
MRRASLPGRDADPFGRAVCGQYRGQDARVIIERVRAPRIPGVEPAAGAHARASAHPYPIPAGLFHSSTIGS